jgi:hypothetical protein
MKMLVSRATNLVREPLTRPIRKGKTARDKENGNEPRRRARQQARAAWQEDLSVKEKSRMGQEVPAFPI